MSHQSTPPSNHSQRGVTKANTTQNPANPTAPSPTAQKTEKQEDSGDRTSFLDAVPLKEPFLGFGLGDGDKVVRFTTGAPVFARSKTYESARDPKQGLSIITVRLKEGLTDDEYEGHYLRVYNLSMKARDTCVGLGIAHDLCIVEFGYRAYLGVFREGDIKVLEGDPAVKVVGRPNGKWKTAGVVSHPTWSLEAIATTHWNEGKYQKGLLNGFKSRVPRGWEKGRLGLGSTVYVIDDRVNVKLKEFMDDAGSSRMASGADFVPPTDVRKVSAGHGNAVASLVGGRSLGVATGCGMVSVNVIKDGNDYTYSDVILSAIHWVLLEVVRRGQQQRSVINISLEAGNDVEDVQIQDLLDTVGVSLDVVAVYAAGNDGETIGTLRPMHPLMSDHVVVVGGLDCSGALWEGSNRGAVLSVLAPSENMIVAVEGDKTDCQDGTSFAAPLVAGTFACLQASPLTPKNYLDILRDFFKNHCRDGVRGTNTKILCIN